MINYARLKTNLEGDIHSDVRDNFDIDTIVHNATEKNGVITVKCQEFWFKYDAITYEQLAGGGGISNE